MCKKSVKYISKKVLSSKVPYTSGVKGSEPRDSFIALQDYHEMGVVPPGGTTGQVLAKCSNSNYVLEWVDNVPVNAIEEIVVENTLFVMKNGNDVTGVRERFDLPFLTINAAMAAAQNGDTVIVYSGSYVINENEYLLKSGVSLYCHPNVIISSSKADTIIIQASGTNSITGYARFIFNADNPSNIIIPTNNFRFEGKDLYLTGNVGMYLSYVGKVDANVIIKFDYMSFSYQGFTVISSISSNSLTIDISTVTYSSDHSFFMDISNLTQFKLTVNINQLTFRPIGDFLIRYSNNAPTTNLSINIGKLIQDNYSSEYQIYTIFRNNECDAHKNIEVSDMLVSCLIYDNASIIPTGDIETGTYKLSGKIRLDEAIYSLIDFKKEGQSITFELDLVVTFDTVHPDYTGSNKVLNISKTITILSAALYNQVIRGRITALGASIGSTDGVIEYGDDALVNSAALLSDLRIVATNQPSIVFIDPLSTAVLPVLNVYVNTADAGAPVYAVDGSITVDVNVR